MIKRLGYQLTFWGVAIITAGLLTVFSYCAWGALCGLVESWTNIYWTKFSGLILLAVLIFCDIQLSKKIFRREKNNVSRRAGGLMFLAITVFVLTFTLLFVLSSW